MTGAQERAFARLQRKFKVRVVTTSTATPDVQVSYEIKDAFGKAQRIDAHITPEGRVVRQP